MAIVPPTVRRLPAICTPGPINQFWPSGTSTSPWIVIFDNTRSNCSPPTGGGVGSLSVNDTATTRGVRPAIVEPTVTVAAYVPAASAPDNAVRIRFDGAMVWDSVALSQPVGWPAL